MKFQVTKLPFVSSRFMVLVGLLLLGAVISWPRLVTAADPDPVTAAWEKARAAGSYEFSSDVTQITIPVAQVTNIGRQSRKIGRAHV